MTAWIIKTDSGYVRSSKEDTIHIQKAKRFETAIKARRYATTNVGTNYIKIVEVIVSNTSDIIIWADGETL